MKLGMFFASVTCVALASCQKSSEKAPKTLAAAAVVAPPVDAPDGSDGAGPACAPIEPSAYDIGPLDSVCSRPAACGGSVDPKLADAPLGAIVDASHDLDGFYERLARLVRGKAKDHVRIAIYGDSNMTMDFISGTMRRLVQQKFGDGGHGYVALARPWAWYHHMDVDQKLAESKWRRISTSTDPVHDGHYSAANIATETSTIGAWSYVATAADGPIGGKVSSVDVFYLKRPMGGSFALEVDGKKVRDVDATAKDTTSAFEHLDLPDGPHKIQVVAKSGVLRLFGATLERQTPSIIVDSLGTGALNYEQMLHVSDASRRPMLQRRKYDLIVFLIGTNLFAPPYHEKWMKKDIGDIESAVPNTPILILSPPDIELHQKDKHSDPRIVALSKQLADIAQRNGWAFWDFWAAMGGDMSMIRFAKSGLSTWDLVHLTHDGGALMGNRLTHAIFDGFGRYVREHPLAGCSGR